MSDGFIAPSAAQTGATPESSQGFVPPSESSVPNDYLSKTETGIHEGAEEVGGEIAGMGKTLWNLNPIGAAITDYTNARKQGKSVMESVKSAAFKPQAGPATANAVGQGLLNQGEEAANLATREETGVDVKDELRQLPLEYQAYEKARSEGKSLKDSAAAAMLARDNRDELVDKAHQIVTEFKKNPGQMTGKAVIPLVLTAIGLSELGGAEAETEPVLAGAGEDTAAEEAANVVPKQPGIIQRAIKGPKVAQPGTEAAVRTAVKTAAEPTGEESMMANIENQPVVKGANTVMDEHLDNLLQDEQATYKKLDETAGFDLKAEKVQLSNDRYKLSQLGNTDADVTQRGNLTESINDSTERIAEAEKNLKAKGIDPKEGDRIHQQRMAGQDVRNVLTKHPDMDAAGLAQDFQKLRNVKVRGKVVDRLAQYVGSEEKADAFVDQLGKMKTLADKAKVARYVRYFLTYEAAKKAFGWTGGAAAKVTEILP